jgi:hypothetical protein
MPFASFSPPLLDPDPEKFPNAVPLARFVHEKSGSGLRKAVKRLTCCFRKMEEGTAKRLFPYPSGEWFGSLQPFSIFINTE